MGHHQPKEGLGHQGEVPLLERNVVTAGDVAFYGNMQGVFKAVNARSGEVLWSFQTGSGIIGQPTTYKGPDGKQYVAILSGVGGWAGHYLVSHSLSRWRAAARSNGFKLPAT